MGILPEPLNKKNYFLHSGKKVKSPWMLKRLTVLDCITLNKEGVIADITLNLLCTDRVLKELELCGRSQNQIQFNQPQHIFLKENHIRKQIHEKPFINLALYRPNFLIPTYMQAKNTSVNF